MKKDELSLYYAPSTFPKQNSSITGLTYMPGLNHYFRLHQAIERIRKEAIAEYWEKENKDDIIAALTPRQMNYLMIIHKRGPCTLQEIMGLTGLSASASSAAVDKLVKLGILSRKTDETNRRFIRVSVTEELLGHLERIDLLFREKVNAALKSCKAEDISALEEISDRILTNMNMREQ